MPNDDTACGVPLNAGEVLGMKASEWLKRAEKHSHPALSMYPAGFLQGVEELERKADERDLYAKALELACGELVRQEQQFYGRVHSKLIIKPEYWLDAAKEELK